MRKIRNIIVITTFYLFHSIKDVTNRKRLSYNFSMMKKSILHLLNCNEYDVIISYTSHSVRVAKSPEMLHSILKGDYKKFHLVLTLYKEDLPLLTGEIKRLVDCGIVELIVADKDLGPHLKYFYVMQKYRNLPIITLDDDSIYSMTQVSDLMQGYRYFPDSISARRCFCLEEQNGELASYRDMIDFKSNLDYPSMKNFATGVGGILYPPNILEISEDMVSEILEMKYDDDVVLKAFEVRKGIKIFVAGDPKKIYKSIQDPMVKQIGLWVNGNIEKTQENMIHYKEEFLLAARSE